MHELTNKATMNEPTFRMPRHGNWDKLLDIVGEEDALIHWKVACFWEDSIEERLPVLAKKGYRAVRGYDSARFWSYFSSSNVTPHCGFRPALDVLDPEILDTEILNPDTLKPGEILQRYALYLDGVEQLLPEDPANCLQIPQFKAGQRIEFKEATRPESTITWLYNGECFIADRVLLTCVSFDELEKQGFMSEYSWSFDDNTPVWENEPCKTIEECLQAAKAQLKETGQTDIGVVFIGKPIPFVPEVSAERVLEDIQEQAADFGFGEDWEAFDQQDTAALEELSEALSKEVNHWLTKHGFAPNFYNVENIKPYAIKNQLPEEEENDLE